MLKTASILVTIALFALSSTEAQVCQCIKDDGKGLAAATEECCPLEPYGSFADGSCDVSADREQAPLLIEEYKSCCIDWELTANCS